MDSVLVDHVAPEVRLAAGRGGDPAGDPEEELRELFALTADTYLNTPQCTVTTPYSCCSYHIICCE
jgi:hypothetical protein